MNPFLNITMVAVAWVLLLGTGVDRACGQNEAAATLRRAAGERLLIGTAVSARALENPQFAQLVAAQFNCLTPENEMKPDALQAVHGRFTFERADRIVAFAQANRMQVIGHTLCWHQQSPAWLFQDENNKPLPREAALANLKTHIQTVVGHFKGKIRGWDVVNEAVADGPGGMLRDTPARRAIGDDYVVKAFQFTHEADPDVELYYNDYNIELGPKRERAMELVRQIKAAGVRIDGVGIQSHWMLESPGVAEIERGLKAWAGVGIKLMVSEMDVDVLPRSKPGGANLDAVERDGVDPYRSGLPDAVQRKLAERYDQLFSLLVKTPQVTRISLWGVSDGQSWLNNFPVRGRTNYPLLFDRTYHPKPAFDAVLRVLQR